MPHARACYVHDSYTYTMYIHHIQILDVHMYNTTVFSHREQGHTPNITPTQRSKLFITHWLFKDLRRTCYSMVEMVNKYIPHSSRCWVPRRFNQDPIESAFGQIRNMSGSDRNMNRAAVETGFSELRAMGLKIRL